MNEHDDDMDTRGIQPIHGKRTFIPNADEQFDAMYEPLESEEDEDDD